MSAAQIQAQAQARARQCEQVYSDLFKHMRAGNGNLTQSARTTGGRLGCNPGQMTSAEARGKAARNQDIGRKRQEIARRCEPVYRDLHDKARAGRGVGAAQANGARMGCDRNRMTQSISQGQTALRNDQARRRQGTIVTPYGGPSVDMPGGCSILGQDC